MRADFELSRDELRDADRGADDVDLEALDKAAHQIAVAENVAVFHGWKDAITGIAEASPHKPAALGEVTDQYPRPVAGAVEQLLCNGIAVPTAWRSGASSTGASSRPPSTAATRCSTTCTRSSRARSSGPRA